MSGAHQPEDDDCFFTDDIDPADEGEITFHLDREYLWEVGWRTTYRYTRWDVEFGVWCQDTHGEYRVIPTIDLRPPVERNRRRKKDDQVSEVSTAGIYEPDLMGSLPSPILDALNDEPVRRQSAWDLHLRSRRSPVSQYMALIPSKLRTTVEAFESDHWFLLEGAHKNPSFCEYLIESVQRFGPALIQTLLRLLNPGQASETRRALFYHELPRLSPSAALAWLSGRQIAPGAARILPRLDRVPTNDVDLMALCMIMGQPDALALLQQQRVIYCRLLCALAIMPDWLWTPRALMLINTNATDSATLVDTLLIARDKATHPQDQALLLGYVSRAKTGERFIERLSDELMESWGDGVRYRLPEQRYQDPYPPPPFPATDMLEPLTNLLMLRTEAKRMNNCVEIYDPSIREGTAYVYRWTGAERASVLLTRLTENDLWFLDETSGIHHEPVSAETLAQIKLALGGIALAAAQDS